MVQEACLQCSRQRILTFLIFFQFYYSEASAIPRVQAAAPRFYARPGNSFLEGELE